MGISSFDEKFEGRTFSHVTTREAVLKVKNVNFSAADGIARFERSHFEAKREAYIVFIAFFLTMMWTFFLVNLVPRVYAAWRSPYREFMCLVVAEVEECLWVKFDPVPMTISMVATLCLFFIVCFLTTWFCFLWILCSKRLYLKKFRIQYIVGMRLSDIDDNLEHDHGDVPDLIYDRRADLSSMAKLKYVDPIEASYTFRIVASTRRWSKKNPFHQLSQILNDQVWSGIEQMLLSFRVGPPYIVYERHSLASVELLVQLLAGRSLDSYGDVDDSVTYLRQTAARIQSVNIDRYSNAADGTIDRTVVLAVGILKHHHEQADGLRVPQ